MFVFQSGIIIIINGGFHFCATGKFCFSVHYLLSLMASLAMTARVIGVSNSRTVDKFCQQERVFFQNPVVEVQEIDWICLFATTPSFT
jgi:hypothetical protein